MWNFFFLIPKIIKFSSKKCFHPPFCRPSWIFEKNIFFQKAILITFFLVALAIKSDHGLILYKWSKLPLKKTGSEGVQLPVIFFPEQLMTFRHNYKIARFYDNWNIFWEIIFFVFPGSGENLISATSGINWHILYHSFY